MSVNGNWIYRRPPFNQVQMAHRRRYIQNPAGGLVPGIVPPGFPVTPNPDDRRRLANIHRRYFPKKLVNNQPYNNNLRRYSEPSILLSPVGGSNATVTPTIFVTSIVHRAPVVSGGATFISTIDVTDIIHRAPTISGGTRVSPAIYVTSITYRAPATAGGATVTPAKYTTSIVHRAVTVSIGGNATVTPSIYSTNIVHRAVAISAGVTIAPTIFNTSIIHRAVVMSTGATVNLTIDPTVVTHRAVSVIVPSSGVASNQSRTRKKRRS